jgi:hypothetical protein
MGSVLCYAPPSAPVACVRSRDIDGHVCHAQPRGGSFPIGNCQSKAMSLLRARLHLFFGGRSLCCSLLCELGLQLPRHGIDERNGVQVLARCGRAAVDQDRQVLGHLPASAHSRNHVYLSAPI